METPTPKLHGLLAAPKSIMEYQSIFRGMAAVSSLDFVKVEHNFILVSMYPVIAPCRKRSLNPAKK